MTGRLCLLKKFASVDLIKDKQKSCKFMQLGWTAAAIIISSEPLYTLAKGQSPWNGEGPWNSSQAHTIQIEIEVCVVTGLPIVVERLMQPGSQPNAIPLPSGSCGPFFTISCTNQELRDFEVPWSMGLREIVNPEVLELHSTQFKAITKRQTEN